MHISVIRCIEENKTEFLGGINLLEDITKIILVNIFNQSNTIIDKKNIENKHEYEVFYYTLSKFKDYLEKNIKNFKKIE